jgi:hypothetical protein
MCSNSNANVTTTSTTTGHVLYMLDLTKNLISTSCLVQLRCTICLD